jgi:hypothetical protein
LAELRQGRKELSHRGAPTYQNLKSHSVDRRMTPLRSNRCSLDNPACCFV